MINDGQISSTSQPDDLKRDTALGSNTAEDHVPAQNHVPAQGHVPAQEHVLLPSHIPARTNTDLAQPPPDARQKDEDALEWFARSLGKPNDSDFAEMLRWTERTMQAESIEEYRIRWITKARPILDKLDSMVSQGNVLQVKRTILLVVTADYMDKPRQKVFELDGTASRTAWTRWMKRPDLKGVYHEVYRIMEDEVFEHELSSIRHATRVTRISAGRAAEIRATLLENPNPWVALQAARDIMQSADKQTAAKGVENTSINISAQLTPTQIDQLFTRASDQLDSWTSSFAQQSKDKHDRPIIIIDRDDEED